MFTLQDYNNLQSIVNVTSPFVSIYIPTYRAGNAKEDSLRLKNAISEAVDQLTDERLFPQTVMNKQTAQDYLSPVSKLLDRDDLWSDLSDGLAVFLNGDFLKYYKVPIDFKNHTYVGNSFYLRHLLPVLDKNNKFFVLTLSQNEVRFFEGRENSITPVIIDDLVPNGIEALIGVDDKEQVLQHHSSGGDAVFHGQGGGKDDKNKQLYKYFRDIDEGLMKMLHDENAPLIIYAVDYEIPMYKEISNYSNLAEAFITGNPENDDPALIHERSWEVIKDQFKIGKAKRKNAFDQAMSEDKASASIPKIVTAAFGGKVEELYVDSQTTAIWGSFDHTTHRVILHQKRQTDSLCLLNEIAIATFNNGGKVNNIPRVEFPILTSQVNAIYRY